MSGWKKRFDEEFVTSDIRPGYKREWYVMGSPKSLKSFIQSVREEAIREGYKKSQLDYGRGFQDGREGMDAEWRGKIKDQWLGIPPNMDKGGKAEVRAWNSALDALLEKKGSLQPKEGEGK